MQILALINRHTYSHEWFIPFKTSICNFWKNIIYLYCKRNSTTLFYHICSGSYYGLNELEIIVAYVISIHPTITLYTCGFMILSYTYKTGNFRYISVSNYLVGSVWMIQIQYRLCDLVEENKMCVLLLSAYLTQ